MRSRFHGTYEIRRKQSEVGVAPCGSIFGGCRVATAGSGAQRQPAANDGGRASCGDRRIQGRIRVRGFVDHPQHVRLAQIRSPADEAVVRAQIPGVVENPSMARGVPSRAARHHPYNAAAPERSGQAFPRALAVIERHR